MIDKSRTVAPLWIVVAVALLSNCSGESPTTPTSTLPPSLTSPPQPWPPATGLVTFTEPLSEFSTADLRDVDGEILHVTSAGELIWTVDGTRLPGYRAHRAAFDGTTWYWISGTLCPEGCALEIRFGSDGGERRAYLTADYGHYNPGTLVDIEVAGNTLSATRTQVFPPGAPMLSGAVWEDTPQGTLPVASAWVVIAMGSGWRTTQTDHNGFYTLPGLYNTRAHGFVSKDGYQKRDVTVQVDGDTRLNVELVRLPPSGAAASAGGRP